MRNCFHIPVLVFLQLQILLYCTMNKAAAFDSATDVEALLNFKSAVSDPQKALSGWSLNSSHCTWFGVSCWNDKERVRSLNLSRSGISGMIPPQLSNLSSLESLNLRNNSFYGPIPIEFSQLTNLTALILGRNSISGSIPSGLSQCYNLKEIRLEVNQLNGSLPPELGYLKRLEFLDVAINNLTGPIPTSFGNLSSLTYIALARNRFYGSIPDELGNLQKLVAIQFSENHLTGKIPNLIFNMSSLAYLSLTNNELSGELPPDMGRTNLEQLFLANNTLEGQIPSSLSNASRLQQLDLSSNNFQGGVPLFGMMKHLVKLHLGFNNLSTNTEMNYQLIDSLSNCTQLEYLMLNSNRLAGEFPSSVANLSIHLREFCVDDNSLTGIFPQGLERFQNLTALALHQNQFRGKIPISIGKLNQLRRLNLQRNRFTGQIPDVFTNLTNLYILTLGSNQLSGTIPASIGQCQHLATLGLPQNRLEGRIPKEIFRLSSLSNLYLAGNNLSGSLPLEVNGMAQLEIMDASSNMLSGNIPETISSYQSLHSLSLAGNKLTGAIPERVGKLRALESLDLSSNTLSGPIPKTLENLLILKKLNLSFNDLEGPVPTQGIFMNISWDSIQGNEKLCGSHKDVVGRLRVPTCREDKKSNNHLLVKIMVPLAASIVVLVSILCFIWAIVSRSRRKRGNLSSPLVKGSVQTVSYSDLWHATNGFAEENLVGKGGYGTVYKAEFSLREDGVHTTLAVKVIDLKLSKADKSFNTECEALKNIRHRNLVKVVTSCSSIDHGGAEFKALVMEFMTNGNLGQWLYPDDIESDSILTLNKRLHIAIDVASAMGYLHHDCDPPLAHCDIKPGNVLLDDNMVAHLGDFGLARFLSNNTSQNESNTIGLKGSTGYIPPEYGLGSKVSTEGDVYSFGILLLEMFTAKKPTDEIFQEALNLNRSASEGCKKLFMEIVDPRLMKDEGWSVNDPWTSSSSGTDSVSHSSNGTNNWYIRREECLADVIMIGMSCVVYSAKQRLTMREALRRLKDIRTFLLGQ